VSSDNQNFGNHARFVPGYHYVTVLLAVVYLVWAIYRAMTIRDAATHFELVGAVALVGTALYARVFALQAQNRVIRLEEQMRLVRILPTDLQASISSIHPAHLIAIRFASDPEVPELVRQVIANPAMTGKEIKSQIKSWRADDYRV